MDSSANAPPTPFSVFKEVETQVKNLGIEDGSGGKERGDLTE